MYSVLCTKNVVIPLFKVGRMCHGVVLFCRGLPFDKSVIHTVESVVIDWSHQVRDVLKKSSAQPLLDGKNPGPMVEIDFWKARNADLQSVFEQVGGEINVPVACTFSIVRISHITESRWCACTHMYVKYVLTPVLCACA